MVHCEVGGETELRNQTGIAKVVMLLRTFCFAFAFALRVLCFSFVHIYVRGSTLVAIERGFAQKHTPFSTICLCERLGIVVNTSKRQLHT